jgi:threonyl-tRNA synthetase
MTKDSKDLVVNATAKWKVLDAPGVQQPNVADVANEVSNPNKAIKDGGGAQGRRAITSTGPKMEATSTLIGGDSFTHRSKDSEWLQTRNQVYETIKQRRSEEQAAKTPTPIAVTLPDGTTLDKTKDGTRFKSYETTPYVVAATISQGLADSATVARVTYESFAPDYSLAQDGMQGADTLLLDDDDEEVNKNQDDGVERATSETTFLWDMSRPLVGTVALLEFLKFETDKDAKTVFWHSSAHMMGEALENLWGCKLTIGPPLAGGFYYDSYMGQKDALREEDCKYTVRMQRSAHLRLFMLLLRTFTALTAHDLLPVSFRRTGGSVCQHDCKGEARV